MYLRAARCVIVFLLLLSSCCQAAAAWRIGVDGGCVALWEDGILVERSTTPVRLLPPQDRALLEQGIELPSQAEARSRMEDFCS